MNRATASALLLTLVTLLATAGLLPAQRRCSKCKGEKYVACTKRSHDPRRVCLIEREHKCDACFGARCCNGLGKIACPSCNDPVAEAELENLRAGRLRWLEATQAMDKKAGLRYGHVETDQFSLHVSLPRWQTKARNLDRSRAAHVFADRLEANAERIAEITGLRNRRTHDVWVVKDSRESKITTLEFLGTASDSFLKLTGNPGKWVAWPRAPGVENDEDMHTALVHHGTHLVMASIYNTKQPRWLEVGMAHWLELEKFETHRHYCFNETQPKNAWENADWRKKIAGELRTGKTTPLAEFVDHGLERLDHRLHAYCWSYCDFIIRGDHGKTKDFFRELLSRSTADAIDAAFGTSMRAFQDAWAEFVRSKYVF